MTPSFYSDNDPSACAWLRELIAEGHLPKGTVDERPIQEVTAADLAGFTACHFFAGIGGWAYALELAGWPRGRAIWSGSCPCQPFSAAGKRKGQSDERHLWPVFLRLIRECRPATVFGEQVASDDGYRWLARVRDDLEEAGYAVGCADLPACSAGAPHIRQRLFWVADAGHIGTGSGHSASGKLDSPKRRKPGQHASANGTHGRLADADGGQPRHGGIQPGREHGQQPEDGGAGGGVGDARRGRRSGAEPELDESGGPARGERHPQADGAAGSGPDGFWSGAVLIPCADGKWRRVPADAAGRPESALFPLAAGIPGRVGLLRGAGNAIVSQVAAKFIKAFLEAEAVTC